MVGRRNQEIGGNSMTDDFMRFYLGIDKNTSSEINDTISLLTRLVNNKESLENFKVNVFNYEIQYNQENK